MGEILMTGGSGGGTGSDECTATLDHVLAGKTAVTKDSHDEPGNGRMTVNSLLSFSVAAYSGRRVLAKWQNPKAAIGKPYSGVYIRYSTSGYPGKTGGTQIYKGAGSNTASEGQSQAYLDLPALNTTYYLSIYPYVTCSAGEMTGAVINATVKTSTQLTVTIKGTQTYTIPAGFSRMDAFAVGGGGLGSSSDYSNKTGGGGGGGGYTKTVKGIAITPGQTLACTVGPGATSSVNGNPSTIVRNGTTLISAGGGKGIQKSSSGSDGGSGGGRGNSSGDGYAGGSDGRDGGGGLYVGSGQGSTTRAFGEPSGTLYAAGGGGGAGKNGSGGAGGSGGGGKGGNLSSNGSNGSANTGGGGGGGGMYAYGMNESRGGSGGSGIILLRLY
ncbi:hypothetical protein K250101E9_41630 [Enterocloster aldenensis]|uniref:glycine-rich domain-containing protein n=1 Tax=Enterocloster aldenensis TaxID=358742 RepID=UPI0034ACFD30